ncbi:hypothetical protein BGZ76_002230, partial [Entomortierella beljakovae]
MLPSTTSNNSSSYTVGHQPYDNETDKDNSSLTNSAPDSPNRSVSSYPHSQLNNQNNSNAGYLSPLSAQHSTVPQIRSPLAMSFNSQGNSNSVALNTRSNYNTRIRGRRDSFQSSVAFSPTMGHSSPNGSNQMNLSTGVNNLYSSQSRLGYIWSGNGPNVAGNNRNRCLSTSSVDSNASSVGLSHLTPALAAMSVQHSQQQGSATNSPFQSYSSSPQKNGFHSQYQQSPSDTYSYGSPFSSPLSQAQVPAYDSLSIAASNIAAGIYGSTPPTHSATDMMYGSPSHYGSVPTTTATGGAHNYSSSARYNSSSILPLAPSLYSDPENNTGAYADQYQQTQGYYGQQTQQGLGILSTGGMARGVSPSPDNDDDDSQEQSGSKRNPSGSRVLQTADDIRAVIGKDGKTL